MSRFLCAAGDRDVSLATVPALISVQADKPGEHIALGPLVCFTVPGSPGAVTLHLAQEVKMLGTDTLAATHTVHIHTVHIHTVHTGLRNHGAGAFCARTNSPQSL